MKLKNIVLSVMLAVAAVSSVVEAGCCGRSSSSCCRVNTCNTCNNNCGCVNGGCSIR